MVQASAAYPENTLASFEAALRDGAEGIESGELLGLGTCMTIGLSEVRELQERVVWSWELFEWHSDATGLLCTGMLIWIPCSTPRPCSFNDPPDLDC